MPVLSGSFPVVSGWLPALSDTLPLVSGTSPPVSGKFPVWSGKLALESGTELLRSDREPLRRGSRHSVGAGMQQALEYAEMLDIPFACSSNGDAFLEHDRTATSGAVTREIPLHEFPTPEELWVRYRTAKG